MLSTRIAFIVLGVISLCFTSFCVLGFIATFEPGTDMNWRIGYAVAFVAFIFAMIFFLRQGFKFVPVKKRHKKTQMSDPDVFDFDDIPLDN